jgi:hypothetical protein
MAKASPVSTDWRLWRRLAEGVATDALSRSRFAFYAISARVAKPRRVI